MLEVQINVLRVIFRKLVINSMQVPYVQSSISLLSNGKHIFLFLQIKPYVVRNNCENLNENLLLGTFLYNHFMII